MVEFVQEAWRKVVIHEINKFECEDIAKLHALGMPPGSMGRPFLWADGVIFEHTVMPPTREIIEEQLRGIIHWTSLQFAFMPEYKATIMVDTITIQVGNVSSNKIFSEMAKWLKQLEKKLKKETI